jgi:hypothetical protein
MDADARPESSGTKSSSDALAYEETNKSSCPFRVTMIRMRVGPLGRVVVIGISMDA